ncbi:hypothetical protein TNCV_4415531 [Trichonephila clavipes]|uniref:Uncharacterized protein n=1 Tax=Trichonephila clavipes TaxID=2585209 RepID=A0A8X6S4I6_TRICX|nr:hypothetical protein TNCV_4415531 [Trichonephila clavipes]
MAVCKGRENVRSVRDSIPSSVDASHSVAANEQFFPIETRETNHKKEGGPAWGRNWIGLVRLTLSGRFVEKVPRHFESGPRDEGGTLSSSPHPFCDQLLSQEFLKETEERGMRSRLEINMRSLLSPVYFDRQEKQQYRMIPNCIPDFGAL